MWRSRLWLLYWVSTQILRMPPLARVDRAKAVSGLRRVPAPPARTIPRTDGCGMCCLLRSFNCLRVMLPRIGRYGEELGRLLDFCYLDFRDLNLWRLGRRR